MKRFLYPLVLLLSSPTHPAIAGTVWNFDNTAERLAASSGSAVLSYYDSLSDNWGPTLTAFGSASDLGLPLINGEDPQVMSFPATTPEQGYQVAHGFAPNGHFEDSGLVSNYTLVMDICFPSTSDGQWRSLMQSDPTNTTDGDLFVENEPGGGFGIGSNYVGSVEPDRWHRVVWAVRSAEGEGQALRYLNGEFVGARGTTGSGLGSRWALSDTFLFFADNNNETAPGFVSSIYLVDRKMTAGEISALGGPNAAGANVPGNPGAPTIGKISRPVKILGHRGSSGSAPENTLAAIGKSFAEGAAGTEIDTRLTSDGVVIVFHDATVDRTTDGTGEVASMTLAEIKELDAGSWFGAEFAGEKVPTLEEALTASKGKGIIFLDIKTEGQAAGFLDAVTKSGFPLEDLWFWTPGEPAYAMAIREVLPEARIVWGNPGTEWETNPEYFNELRDLGVIGFSFRQSGANPKFVAKAKEEGMFVEVYTLLDPDQLAAAASAGVDYVETDFPEFMLSLQPEQENGATGPSIPDGTTEVFGNPVLSWIPGSIGTTQMVYFGTENPPPFVREQEYDLFQTPELEPNTTYYWKIDTRDLDAILPGEVWSFTTFGELGEEIVHEWHLNGDLDGAAGDAILSFAADSVTSDAVMFETSDGVVVPHMANGPSDYLRIPAFSDPTQGLDLTFTTTGANGGGEKINQYSFVFDILVPGPMGWTPFFNTNPTNTDDGDFFLRPSGGMGIGALGYAADGTILEGGWKRVIFSADLKSGLIAYYVDGEQILQRTLPSLQDGRFSLLDNTSPAPHVRLFNDDNAETTEILVGAVAFIDQALTSEIASELGPPDARGIFFPDSGEIQLELALEAGSNAVVLTWNAGSADRFSVETSTDLLNWEEVSDEVSGTDGIATFRHPVFDRNGEPKYFYRVVKQ